LSRTLFPIGRLTKPEVREVARRHGLALADKPDSQEICFIPGGDYKQFLAAYLEEQGEQVPVTAGELVASSGEVLGHHVGISNFTVGQRKGLGVSSPSPLYVLNIDPASHRVTVGADAELAVRTLRARNLNWISIPELTGPMRVRVKIRHRHEPAWAVIEPLETAGPKTPGAPGPDSRTWDSPSPTHEVIATFDEPQRAVTPGQSAVFYDGNEVVGGGWIV
jgi:tRNA-specific 2-thiouridylase